MRVALALDERHMQIAFHINKRGSSVIEERSKFWKFSIKESEHAGIEENTLEQRKIPRENFVKPFAIRVEFVGKGDYP